MYWLGKFPASTLEDDSNYEDEDVDDGGDDDEDVDGDGGDDNV